MLRLRELRKQNKLSQQQLALLLGVTQATLSGWETEKYRIDNNSLIKCSEILNTTTDYLLGKDSIDKNIKPIILEKMTIKIPVLCRIPAGVPMEAIEDIIDYIEIPDDWTIGDKEYFALKINGDSMSPEYLSGDVVIFRKCETCNNGDDCAVMVNGDDATFKRIERKENGIILKPLNAAYEISFFTNEDIESKPVRILGIAVELRRKK